MITNLVRTNDPTNPHEGWSFELIATGETYYYMTGPEYDIQLVESKWDENRNYLGSVPVGYKKQPAGSFLSVIRGKEPYEIETMWYLPEFLSFKDGDIESKIIKLLILGEKTIEEVCYPP